MEAPSLVNGSVVLVSEVSKDGVPETCSTRETDR